jgi:hypothetical protein
LLCTSYWFLAWLILKPWWRMRYFPPNRLLNFNVLHGIISQKIKLFRLKYIAKVRPETSQQSIFSTECSGCCNQVEITLSSLRTRAINRQFSSLANLSLFGYTWQGRNVNNYRQFGANFT